MERVVIITGGTSGIGAATAKALAARGCRVYEFSRREAELSYAEHVRVDVTDEAAVRAAVDAVAAREGHIDILINNAGMGISGAFEFTESKDAHRLMEVNLFGMNNTIRAALPHMRACGGRIINLSSVAAVFPVQFQAWYSVSKAAVAAMSTALANEVRPFGIRVCCVFPGDIQTGFTDARKKSAAGDDVYGGRIASSVARMEKDERTGMTSAAAGNFIADIALRRHMPAQATIGGIYRLFTLLGRLLPAGCVRSILGKMYG